MDMELSEIKKWLNENDMEDTLVFENPSFEEAIVGISSEGNLIYDYDLMIESLSKEYLESSDVKEEDSISMAIEWIDYNTLRSLPYMRNIGKEPIIAYRDFD